MKRPNKNSEENTATDWLVGGGDMGELIRSMDWSATPLGPRTEWPYLLQAITNVVLSSTFATAILWGKDLTFIYNDAYRVIAADKHPHALGRSTWEIWPEVWEFNKPIFEKVMKEGQTIHLEDQLFRINRRAKMEDAYFTLSYSPIWLDNSRVGGTLVTLIETTQRLQAEKALRESEARYCAIIEDQTELICRYLPNGKINFVNQAYCGYFGKEFDELVGNSFYPSIVEEDRIKVQEIIATLSPENPIVTVEERVVLPDQQIRWQQWASRLILDEQNQAIEIQAVGRDITERKRAENALRDGEVRYKKLFQFSPDPIIIHDMDMNIIDANDKATQEFGYSKEELLERTIFELHSGTELEHSAQVLAAMKQKDMLTVETKFVRKEGSVFLAEATPCKFTLGSKPIIYVAIRDITERKQAEEALRERMKELRCLYSVTEIIEKSDTTEEILQKTADIMPSGLNYPEIACVRITREDQEFKTENFQETEWKISTDIIVGDKTIGVMEVRYLEEMPDRDEGPFLKEERELISAVAERLGSTIERKGMESQLIQSQKMESIGNLAGGIAHDFNNILSSVIGFTELSLDEVEKGTQIEDNLQEVYTAGKRAKDLVNQILAFARQSEKELKPIPVDTIATEVLKFIRSSIPTTIEIRQNIESDSLIMGNATQIHQILMNLFTNAAHAMEDKGGILEFSLKDIMMDSGVNRGKRELTPGNYIEIRVADTGTGIAPEIIGSIFDPYFTTKGPGEGTGMGLAMVHGIVESYGGKILVDGKQGQGTLFTIYLPATRKRQEHRPYQSEELPAGTERILFVDDEAPIAKMGGQALEGLGYTVSIRTSSIEALELFRTKPNAFDLVITDTTMPNMTGDRLAIELMKIRFDIPIILCTGYSKKISDESAVEIGIKAFAYKPVVKADLAKTVRKVLDESKDTAK